MLRVVQDEYLFVINVITARSLHSETIYLVQTTFSKKNKCKKQGKETSEQQICE